MSQERPPSSQPMPAPLPADGSGTVAYRVTLPEFEGPLDLLLHLCQTHELDILNISIAFIAEKYIEYLELMQNMSVEVAADYLVMAAHLAYLKSRELVPAPEPLETSEEGEELLDPREELIRRLLEYQKYKHAAENLGNRPIEGRNVFVRGAVLEAPGEAGLAEHSVWKLIEHWAGMLKKAKPQYTHDVVVDRMSITDRINQIVDLLTAGKGMVRFEDLLGQDLPSEELRHKVVVSLLAVLELARLRVIRILQQPETGSFFLAQTDNADLEGARHLQVTSAKQDDAPEPSAASPTGESQPTPGTGEAPAREAAPIPADDLFSDEIRDHAVDDVLAEPHSPLEEGATAAVIASADDAADEAAQAAAEAEQAFPDQAEESTAASELTSEATVATTDSATDALADKAADSLADKAAAAEGATENQPAVVPDAAEQLAGDTVRQGQQDGVISAPFPAPAPESEEPIHGQAQEEQEISEK